MPTLGSAGARLAWREEGSGPPLVLVHGSPADGRAWTRVVPHLRDRFRLLAVDLPGYGGSDPVPDELEGRASAMGGRLARLVEGLGRPVHLAGHSFGGVIALNAALQAKTAVASLLLLEPVFMRGLALTDVPALAAARAHFDDYVARVGAGETGAVSRMVDFWFGNGAYARLPDPVRAFLDANARPNALDVQTAFHDTADRAALAAFAAPVVVAYGDRSPAVIPAIARAIAKLMPSARLEAMAGANHAMLDTHPAEVARLIAGAGC